MEITKISTPQVDAPPKQNGNTTGKKVIGYSAEQIFEDGRSIFKLLSSGEKLYRYKYDSVTNEVIEKAIYKRVHRSDFGPGYLEFKRKLGKSYLTQDGFTYALYALFTRVGSRMQFRGYALYDRTLYSSQGMYYIFERFEKNGG